MKEKKIKKSIFEIICITFMLTIHIACLGAIMQDGLISLTAWYIYQLLVPVTGIIFLIIFMIRIFKNNSNRTASAIAIAMAATCILPALQTFQVVQFEFPQNLNTTTPKIEAELPSKKELITCWGGDKVEKNYHAAHPDQRWAYDFVIAPSFNMSNKNEDYGCFGTDVLSPINGEIAVAIDGLPDEVPGKLSANTKNPAGNHIAIKTIKDTYILIGHLKKDSVKVKVGHKVKAGEIIGQCGNSGNTSEPHIHIHHQKQNPAEFPIGFAEGLPMYFKTDRGIIMPEGGVEVKDGRIIAKGERVKQP